MGPSVSRVRVCLNKHFWLALTNSKNWLSLFLFVSVGPVVMVKISLWVLGVSCPVLFPQYTIIYCASLFHMVDMEKNKGQYMLLKTFSPS